MSAIEPVCDRYRVIRSLSRRDGREVDLGHDHLSGRAVVLKSAAWPQARREARVLLELPRGIAPRLTDLSWSGAGSLRLVLEHLPGRMLDEIAPELTAEQIPSLVRKICQCLIHLHRAGWVHCDLKPQNILVSREDDGRLDVRLLDFGFALGMVEDPEDGARGSTPPYVAPEVSRGWIVDGRADLFSLGVIVKELFPRLSPAGAWGQILEKLVDRVPGRRFPHGVALRHELERAFALPPSPDRFPRFGAGPLRGREETIEALTGQAQARTGSAFLVQARPGAGLSRILLECVFRLADANGPPSCMIDLAEAGPSADPDRLGALLDGAARRRRLVFLGVGDPSPGLHWIDESWGDRLRRRVEEDGWLRAALPPLDPESFEELVATSLGCANRAIYELAERLHHAADGDLGTAAEGFRACVERGGREEGPAWNLDPADLREALSAWHPAPPPPRSGQLPARLFEPLRICARAGRSSTRPVASGLLQRFYGEDSSAELCDHGYLRSEPGDRLAFVTRGLWSDLYNTPPRRAPEIDAWLVENQAPQMHQVDELLLACRRARRMRNRVREGELLAAGIRLADAERRWGDLLRLFTYSGGTIAAPSGERIDPPDGGSDAAFIEGSMVEPFEAWTAERVRERVRAIGEITGDRLGADRLFCMAAVSVNSVNFDVGTPLLEEAAQCADPAAAAVALILLAGFRTGRKDDPVLPRHLAALRKLIEVPGGPNPGVPDSLQARHAFLCGDVEQAEALARSAAGPLHGSGLVEESFNQQLLAILLFGRDPEAGIATMREALAAAGTAESQAQTRMNLAIMLSDAGHLEAAAECADEGIRTLRGRMSRAIQAHLRTLRAWTWAKLDRIPTARKEAESLLSLPLVRQSSGYLVPVRALLGYCHLHRGADQAALRLLFQSWGEAATGSPAGVRADILRYFLDGLCDLEAWDFVRENGLGPECDMTTDLPEVQTAACRVRALRRRMEGELEEAAAMLEERREAVRRISVRPAAARYLHHLGLVRLAQAQGPKRSGIEVDAGAPGSGPAEAARLAEIALREALEILPDPGYGYVRARILFALSRAQSAAGREAEGANSLERAIRIARGVQSLGLLAQCLRERAERGIRGAGSDR